MRFRLLLWRSLRLRCPLCGHGRLFRGWFRMHDCCSSCGVSFEREPGFFLGSIYFNYGLTALIATIAYLLLMFRGVMSEGQLQLIMLAFVVLFPLWFFRYARALWLGFDQFWDPRADRAERRDALTTDSDETVHTDHPHD
jgi:uncharacterized protein (DUF983 family)